MKFLGPVLVAVLCVVASTTVSVYGAPPGHVGTTAALAIPAAAAWGSEAIGGIDPAVLSLALHATQCAVQSGDVASLPQTLTIIDYSKPSTAERLWVFDLSSRALLYRELVAHGQGSGDNLPTKFSNTSESHQSSLGLFITEDTYVGKNGYSLRLRGLDTGFNDRAYERAIVMHGAPYVSDDFAHQQGRLGRSWGCPALRTSIAREVIDRVKGGGAVFAYSTDGEWLRRSKYLNGCSAPQSSPTLTTF